MNVGAFVGGGIEILILSSIGLTFLFLFLKPKNSFGKRMKELPVLGTIFRFKYSFLIAGVLCFLKVLLDVINLLGI